MRLSVLIAVAGLLASLGIAQESSATIRKPTNIPAEPLDLALKTRADERDFQIVYVYDELKSFRTEGAVGRFTSEEALKVLLKGTGLTFRYLDEKTVTIVPLSSGAGSDSVPASGVASRAEDAAGGGGAQLEEIVVTAQKKTERLQDVPIPVTVLKTDTLADTGKVLLQDYFSSIPGLSVMPGELGQQQLTIRGIASGQGNPSVSVLIDDIPYFGSWVYTNPELVPDIDPGDLTRVEVLRGPQGTLYGASSMGGLIKYVTVDPSTDGYNGRVTLGTSNVYNGAEPGFNVRGAVNLPLSNDLALRISAFRRQDPGYIDNPVSNTQGVNETQADGVKASALWRPAEQLSLKLNAIYQNIKQNGSSELNPGPSLADLQQNFPPGIGASNNRVQAYTANLNYKVGAITLTSNTGYIDNRHADTLDWGYYSPNTAYLTTKLTTKFSQEVRLSIPLMQRLEWLVGGFYTHEHLKEPQSYVALDPTTGRVVAEQLNYQASDTSEEYAAFTDVTYHVSERFDIQIGGRESHDRETVGTTLITGPLTNAYYGSPPPYSTPIEQGGGNAFTYLLTPRFKLSPDFMVYARLASGYSAGGPNQTLPGVPSKYGPDKAVNYEVGAKGDFLDHALSVDASLYYIKWSSIQLGISSPPPTLAYYTANAGDAKSDGAELSIEARPLRGLTISAWFDYDDAVLTQPFPPSAIYTHGVTGERLPFSSRYSANFSFNEEFPLWGSMTGFVAGMVNYEGNRLGPFISTPERQYFPAYTKADLNAGVKYDSWATNLYVNNVADTRALLNGGIGTLVPSHFLYITPRTIGLNVVKTF